MNQLEQIREIAKKRAIEIGERREEILEAFIAKYGFEPDEMMIFENVAMGSFQVVHNPKWINVNNRLPEKDEYVLVYYNDRPTKSIDIGWYSTICNMWNVGYLKTGTVTHWMPLPEPPK